MVRFLNSNVTSGVNPDFWDQALWRIQRVGNEVHDFLYENRAIGTCVEEIELRPGIAFCLRRFHVMLTQMVRSAWLAHVRRVNGAALGATADLEEFLFGSDRADLSGIRLALIEIQNGVCFYCRSNLPSGAGDVDHFIPWSRYPVDLGHHFVIAHAASSTPASTTLTASTATPSTTPSTKTPSTTQCPNMGGSTSPTG